MRRRQLSVQWNKFNSTLSIYNALLTSGSGCDSSVNLHLTINQPLEVTFSWDSMFGSGLLHTQYYVDTSACISEFPLPLFGGNPPGGFYSGTYVMNNELNTNFYNIFTDTVTYTVTLYGCTGSASDEILLEDCYAGIPAVSIADAISLYPNPASAILTLQSTLFTANKVIPMLYDITGKLIDTDYTRQGDKIAYSTSALATGVYFIKMQIEGNEVVKRFVKVE